jgi:hypothetical protein
MAEYVAVPAGNLVPPGDADPVAAALPADAGLTPYRAVQQALPQLNGGGRHEGGCHAARGGERRRRHSRRRGRRLHGAGAG